MKKFIVQYKKTRFVSYDVLANNAEEAQVVAINLRERNYGYDRHERDDMEADETVEHFRTIENTEETK